VIEIGSDGYDAALLKEMAGLVTAWNRTARDRTPTLTLHPALHLAESNQCVIRKPHADLVFDREEFRPGKSGPTADTAGCQSVGERPS
jgi:hypothetical protein